jgi:hypothetical protein
MSMRRPGGPQPACPRLPPRLGGAAVVALSYVNVLAVAMPDRARVHFFVFHLTMVSGAVFSLRARYSALQRLAKVGIFSLAIRRIATAVPTEALDGSTDATISPRARPCT